MPEIGHLFSTIKRILFNTRTAAPDSSFFPLDMGTADNEYKVYVSENGPLRYGSESVYRGDYLLSIKNFNDAIEAFREHDSPQTRAKVISSASYLIPQHQRGTLPEKRKGIVFYATESFIPGPMEDASVTFTILPRPTASRTAFIFSSSFLSSKDTLPTII